MRWLFKTSKFYVYSAYSALLVMAFASCSRNQDVSDDTTSTIPDTGMYLSSQYTKEQIDSTEIKYSERPNFQNLQYTSEKSKASDRNKPILDLKLTLYTPPNAKTGKKQPLLVMIHGGGFLGGDKVAWRDEAYTYAKAGYVCASINYRLTLGGGNQSPQLRLFAVKTALEDAQNAIRFLKKNADIYAVDVSRVVVFGASAGGVLSLLNAVEADSPLGTSDFVGISSKTNGSIATGASLVNDDPANQSGLITYNASDSPVLMFHAKEYDSGGNGYTWTQNAVPTQQAINNSGNTCELIPQPNMTHIVSLSLGGSYWQYLKPFLWNKLKLSSL